MCRLAATAILLVSLLPNAFGATPAQNLLNQATAFQGFSDKDLQIAKAYSLAVYTGLAGLTAGTVMANAYAQGFAGLEDKPLQIVQAYALSQGLISINVNPNTNSATYGLQEALNAIPAGGPQWGTNVTGALIRLGSGDFYLTNAVFYSNTFPYSIKLQGSGILNTRLIYAGLGTTTNGVIKFCGGGNPGGGLNLPGHVEVCDLTITSITNMQGALLVITNNSYSYIHNVNFTDWELATNNLHGPSLSIDGPAPTQASGNVGLLLGQPLDHLDRVEYCTFAGLACGIDYWGDHLYAEDIKTAFIGQFGAGPGDGTAWANTSPYTLGPMFLIRAGLSVDIVNVHFYQVYTCIMAEAGTGNPVAPITMRGCEWESADQGFVVSSDGQGVTLDQLTPSGGGTGDAFRQKISSRSPYTLAATTFVPHYAVYNPVGMGIDGNNNPVTNFARFSARTNLCSQPAAGFTPNFNLQNEVAATNNGANTAVIFAAGTLPTAYGGDMTYHEVLVRKSTGNDGAIILPAPYVTNISGVFRCTNNTLLEFRIWPGLLTNVFSRPIN